MRGAFRDDMTSGVTGVMGNVARPSHRGGWAGRLPRIGGRFDRRGLLVFGAGIESDVPLIAWTAGAAWMRQRFGPEIVPPAPEMKNAHAES